MDSLKTDIVIKLLQFSVLEIQLLYLEYVNDFLTVERFAEFHGFSVEFATALIEEGRRLTK